MYYFGCIGREGHYLFNVWSNPTRALDEGWPFHENGWDLDGKFCPTGVEVQSLARIVHVEGWTVLAMWDRSVDHRPKCNSNFVERGELSFEQMTEKAKENFPTVWERINKAAPVTLAEENLERIVLEDGKFEIEPLSCLKPQGKVVPGGL